ncbi:MAG: PAS domain S-box protein [Candidatus Cloacimonetes bacterium]|nr:PAS domain S-box protein [Candidatus Cloacimonadota bacterium]
MRTQHLNRMLVAQRHINRLIARERHSGKILEKISRMLAVARRLGGVWIAELDEGGQVKHIATYFSGSLSNELHIQSDDNDLPDCALHALTRHDPYTLAPGCANCASCRWRRQYPQSTVMQVRIEHGRRVFGVMCIVFGDQEVDEDEERSLLAELGESLGYALHNIELELQRRQIDSSRWQSEQRFRGLFEESPDINLILDADTGRILDVNRAIEARLGYDKRQVLGFPLQRIFPPVGVQAACELLEQTRTVSAVSALHDIRCCDGSLCPMELSACLLPWGDDMAIHLVIRDVSESPQRCLLT